MRTLLWRIVTLLLGQPPAAVSPSRATGDEDRDLDVYLYAPLSIPQLF